MTKKMNGRGGVRMNAGRKKKEIKMLHRNISVRNEDFDRFTELSLKLNLAKAELFKLLLDSHSIKPF